MNRYDKYKPSGIDWIGDIPNSWSITKLKYATSSNPSNVDKKSKVGEELVKLCNYVDVYKNEFITNEINFMEATAPADQISKFSIRRGDVIITKDSESAEDIGVPAYVTDNMESVVCGYHLTHIKPIKINGEYLFRQFQCGFMQSYLEISANGVTRYGIGTDKINSAIILMPPLIEQHLIAEYLSVKCDYIDAIIVNKEKLIKLYIAKRQAAINTAITLGVEQGVEMKNSNVSYIGNIPIHWQVKRLKFSISKVGSGVTPKGGASVYVNHGIPLLRSQNIYIDGLRMNDVAFISEEIDESMSNSRVLEGDVLLNITGGSIGRCYYADDSLGRANVNQHVCIIRPIQRKIITKYLYYILRSDVGQEQIDMLQTGANREGLNFEQIKNFMIPLPKDVDEQMQIVENIDSQCTSIDKLVSKLNRQIDLYKEYKTSLIANVVTGKIKITE